LHEGGLKGVKRMALSQARTAATTHEHDYLGAHVADLGSTIDFGLIRSAGLHPGVDPLGRAGVHYWARIAECYRPQTQKQALAKLTPAQITATELAGEPITSVIDNALGNDAPIGGIKVSTKGDWFAARPSGTEDIYKIYAESFRDDTHLRRLLTDAQRILDAALDPKERS